MSCLLTILLSIPLPTMVDTASPPPHHLRYFSFYSHGNLHDRGDLIAQRGIVNVRLGHDASLDPRRAWFRRRKPSGRVDTNFTDVVWGYERYGMASFLDVEALVWNRTLYPAVPAFPTNDYRQMIATVVKDAAHLLSSGAVRGLFLGDELCCTGTSPEDLASVASFCRQQLQAFGHGDAEVYINECARSFIGAGEWGGKEWPGWIKGKIPEGLTLVSLDSYALANQTNHSKITPYWQAEVNTVRQLYQLAFGGGRLAPHQRLMVVPGLYGNDSATPSARDLHDRQLVRKLDLYWCVLDRNAYSYTGRCVPRFVGHNRLDCNSMSSYVDVTPAGTVSKVRKLRPE
jgi:hypothetical protein